MASLTTRSDEEKGTSVVERSQRVGFFSLPSSLLRNTSFNPTLEGLRGLAVLMVIMAHTSDVVFGCLGSMGVSIFFTLSGFLITGTLIKSHSQRERLLQFYTLRLIRLWPPVILCLSMCAYLAVQRGFWKQASPLIWQSGLYLSDFYIVKHAGTFVAHFWSLAIEEQFYLVWPLIVPVLLKRSYTIQLLLLASFAIISLQYRAYLGAAHGMGLYRMKSFGANFWGLVFGSSLRFVRIPLAMQSTYTVYLGVAIILWTYVKISHLYRFLDQDVLSSTAAILIIIGAYGNGSNNALLSCHPIRFIGRVSYSWYLFHMPLLTIYGMRGKNDIGAWSISTASLVIAMASTIYLEEPLRSYARSKFIKSASPSTLPMSYQSNK